MHASARNPRYAFVYLKLLDHKQHDLLHTQEPDKQTPLSIEQPLQEKRCTRASPLPWLGRCPTLCFRGRKVLDPAYAVCILRGAKVALYLTLTGDATLDDARQSQTRPLQQILLELGFVVRVALYSPESLHLCRVSKKQFKRLLSLWSIVSKKDV